MTTFYKVLSNLKHNGQVYEKGSVIEGEFDSLVADKVLSVLQAETLEDAQEEAGAEPTVEAVEEEVAPADTWGPQPDEAPLPTDPTATLEPEVLPATTVPATGTGDVEAPKEETKTDGDAPEEDEAPL